MLACNPTTDREDLASIKRQTLKESFEVKSQSTVYEWDYTLTVFILQALAFTAIINVDESYSPNVLTSDTSNCISSPSLAPVIAARVTKAAIGVPLRAFQ